MLHEAGTGRARRGISAEGLSGELYSDPRREGNDDGRGIENVLVGLIPGLTMSGPRPGGFGRVPVTQYCLEGDPICDLPSPVRRPVSALDGVLGYFTKHGYYPARMRTPVHDDRVWDCTPAAGQTADCLVAAPPASVTVAHEHLDPKLAGAGLPGLPRVVEPMLEAVASGTVTVTPSISLGSPAPSGDAAPPLLSVGLEVDVQVAPPVRNLLVEGATALAPGRRTAPLDAAAPAAAALG